jgi:Plasmid pRiA4b ORF-3-like protein
MTDEPDPLERWKRKLSPEDAKTFETITSRIRSGDPDTVAAVGRELREVLMPEPSRSSPGLGAGPDWYIVRVELVRSIYGTFEPPPGRDVLISPQHTFRQLAETINSAFARWDLGHLYAFRLDDGRMIGTPFEDFDVLEAARTKIGGRWLRGDSFLFEFDFGDSWEHRCSVMEMEVDPTEVYGKRPKGPAVVFGWGSVPDQYGRSSPRD